MKKILILVVIAVVFCGSAIASAGDMQATGLSLAYPAEVRQPDIAALATITAVTDNANVSMTSAHIKKIVLSGTMIPVAPFKAAWILKCTPLLANAGGHIFASATIRSGAPPIGALSLS